jgi:hypothetical protein
VKRHEGIQISPPFSGWPRRGDEVFSSQSRMWLMVGFEAWIANSPCFCRIAAPFSKRDREF